MLLRCILASLVILAAGPVGAEERGTEDSSQARPEELRTSQWASRVIFATQAAERSEAEEAGIPGLADDLRALRAAVERLALTEAVAHRPADRPGSGGSPPPLASRRDDVAQLLASLAAKRGDLQARLPQIRSPRQRRFGERLVQRLSDLDRDVRAAMNAAPQERVEQLAGFRKRLEVTQRGGGEGARRDAPGRNTPTFPPPRSAPPLQRSAADAPPRGTQ